MPLTTPFLPLTVPASTSAASLPIAVFVDGPPHASQHDQREPFAPAPADPPAAIPAFTTTVPARPQVHSRRLTLSRFPLLRKTSRELRRSPSVNHKGSNTTTTPPSADSPFLATGAPRASSSIVRGQEASPPRASTTRSHEADISEEADFDTQAASPRETKPGKMHQTSSRLLRMTDDERPYTRASTHSQYDYSSTRTRNTYGTAPSSTPRSHDNLAQADTFDDHPDLTLISACVQ
jgi:hypothetical protein